MNQLHTYQQTEYEALSEALGFVKSAIHVQNLCALYQQGWDKIWHHGDILRWAEAWEALPVAEVKDVDISQKVRVGNAASVNMPHEEIKAALLALSPWRKGPFEILGVKVDTEWRSDWKWNRVLPYLSPLRGRHVLDIGCGSGYHMWRMLGAGAGTVVGIDPSALFSLHFASVKRYIPDAKAYLIPTGIDEMPDDLQSFDTVFSMGILYHRREPIEHLFQVKSMLKAGGEFVLETLVVDGDRQTCLMPEQRYAKMKNVWFIPSVAMLEIWLRRAGFSDVRCVDVNTTSIEEQRSTAWMTFESLPDYLDINNPNLTVEGYPAAQRAVMIARV